MMMTLREFAERRHACPEGLEWLGERDLAAMWAECQRPDWMLWLLKKLGWDDAHAQRTFALRCARRVEHLMSDARSVQALEVVERYLRGDATADELAAAGAAAWAAAGDAAWAAARAAAGDAAEAAAEAAQSDDLRELVPVATVQALFDAAAQTNDGGE